jgi:heme-degrading monooxygenase HmoA
MREPICVEWIKATLFLGVWIIRYVAKAKRRHDRIMATDRKLDTNGWPERYFAVIFTAQRSLSSDDIYDMTADRMVLLAQRQPGFLGVESVGGDDGIGITVSYWVDRAAIANWRQHAEHLAAQALGRQEFYEWYRIRVAEVVSERSFIAGDFVETSAPGQEA